MIWRDEAVGVAGVYTLTIRATGQQYVGGSTDVNRRFRQHRDALRHDRHRSGWLQAAYDLGGMEAIEFKRLLTCRPEDVTFYEQRAIDELGPELNTEPRAGTSLGVRRTDEQRERLKLRPQSQPKLLVEVKGEILSVPELAKKYGLRVVTVRARLKSGITGDALAEPVSTEPVPRYLVRDRFLTCKQIAARYKLPLTTIYTRVRAGWTGEALTAPRMHRGKNSRY